MIRTLLCCWLGILLMPGICGRIHAETLVISNRGDETVFLYDTESRERIGVIEDVPGAHEFAVSPDGRYVVGSCYGSGPGHRTPDHRLVVLDLEERRLARIVDLGEHVRPNDLRFLPERGKIVVTSEVRQCLVLVDILTGAVEQEPGFGEPGGHMLAVSPDGETAYVPCVMSGAVMVVDLSGEMEEAVKSRIETAVGAEGVDLSPDGRWLWVACNRSESIAVIDTESAAVDAMVKTDGFPFRIRFLPKGKQVIIAHPGQHEVRFWDAEKREVHSTVALPGGLPTCLAVSESGGSVFAVCGPVREVVEIDTEAHSVVHRYDTGPEPDAVACSPLTLKANDVNPSDTRRPSTPGSPVDPER